MSHRMVLFLIQKEECSPEEAITEIITDIENDLIPVGYCDYFGPVAGRYEFYPTEEAVVYKEGEKNGYLVLDGASLFTKNLVKATWGAQKTRIKPDLETYKEYIQKLPKNIDVFDTRILRGAVGLFVTMVGNAMLFSESREVVMSQKEFEEIYKSLDSYYVIPVDMHY